MRVGVQEMKKLLVTDVNPALAVRTDFAVANRIQKSCRACRWMSVDEGATNQQLSWSHTCAGMRKGRFGRGDGMIALAPATLNLNLMLAGGSVCSW